MDYSAKIIRELIDATNNSYKQGYYLGKEDILAKINCIIKMYSNSDDIVHMIRVFIATEHDDILYKKAKMEDKDD